MSQKYKLHVTMRLIHLVFIKNLVLKNEKLIHMIKKILFSRPFNKTLISQLPHHHETIMTIHLRYYFMYPKNPFAFIHSFT